MSDLKIKCDGKEYAIPDLNVDQWLKVIKTYDEKPGKAVSTSLFEAEGVETTLEFYYLLLHDTYPELTKNKLRKMPLYQLGIQFSGLVIGALTEIPFGSVPQEKENAEKA